MAKLVLLHGGEAIPHRLADGTTLLGRHPDCDIQLESNAVSRRHAQVSTEAGRSYLEDLDSGNGTFVNGQRITERVLLEHSDRVKLGPVLLRFEEDDVSAGEQGRTAVGFEITDTDSATIMASVNSEGGFGILDVHPEAKLKGVLEISRALAGTLELDELLPKVLDSLFKIFPQVDRGCILLKDPHGEDMIPRAMKHRREDEDATVRLSQTVVDKVLAEKSGLLSADASTDDQFSSSQSISDLSIRSMICVPLLGLDSDPIGVINLDTQNQLNQFNTDDLELLMSVAGQAALSYENARLMESYMAKQKQDNELEIAHDVQRALLPTEFPVADGYSFYASYHSAQAVGGDYYDVLRLDGNRVCLAFGDVAGKGVPGALIMARISSCVQNTMSFTSDLVEAITAINSHMCVNAAEGRFVTFVLSVIDLDTHQLSLVNAGHMCPMILRVDGSIEEFGEEAVGLPIGVVEDFGYEVVGRLIEPGETVVIFTDGVDEAMNPDGELYTLERMRRFLADGPRKADELGEALLSDVRRFAAGTPQNDDITIMAFGRDAAT